MTSLVRKQVYDHIDGHLPEHLKRLQELVRQPSISMENKGISECAELVKRYLQEIGCAQTSIVETSLHPVVYGEYDAGADKTVIVYMMYDTMPVEEPGWIVAPLDGKITDFESFGKCLVARGSYNTKGPLAAFINACKSIREADQELPVNLRFVAEGEEELGSKHLPQFIEKYKRKLQASDVVFFPSTDQDRSGKIINQLGVKGIIYFELELDGKSWGFGPTECDIHGSHKAWVDSPTWRMINALSSMTTPDGNKVLIEGFYDNVIPPSSDDLELVQILTETFDEKPMKEMLSVKKFIDDSRGKEALLKYLYTPSLNINGIWSGYTGPGTKTVLPWKITAKVDVRLIPNMTVKEVLPKIRRHLDKHGFKEVRIVELEEGYGWAKTSVKHPAAQALIKAYKDFNYPLEIWPHIAGSVPFSMFNREPLNLPFIMGGVGHGGRSHSPNEYLVVEEGGKVGGLATLEKSYVAILYSLAEMRRPA
jgi:acetylornithine deacetylase/succinyl-diaminopimelate desuccinylase-like protein